MRHPRGLSYLQGFTIARHPGTWIHTAKAAAKNWILLSSQGDDWHPALRPEHLPAPSSGSRYAHQGRRPGMRFMKNNTFSGYNAHRIAWPRATFHRPENAWVGLGTACSTPKAKRRWHPSTVKSPVVLRAGAIPLPHPASPPRASQRTGRRPTVAPTALPRPHRGYPRLCKARKMPALAVGHGPAERPSRQISRQWLVPKGGNACWPWPTAPGSNTPQELIDLAGRLHHENDAATRLWPPITGTVGAIQARFWQPVPPRHRLAQAVAAQRPASGFRNWLLPRTLA